MNRRTLLSLYQWLTGLSDTSTGLLLIFAPSFTLRLMHLHPVQDAAFVSYVGVFVLSVGIACLYGTSLVGTSPMKLEMVWLLTGITRGLVAIFVAWKIAAGVLEPGWISVSLSDGVLAAFQFTGLAKGWLRHDAD